jgi:hypothetical protein
MPKCVETPKITIPFKTLEQISLNQMLDLAKLFNKSIILSRPHENKYIVEIQEKIEDSSK